MSPVAQYFVCLRGDGITINTIEGSLADFFRHDVGVSLSEQWHVLIALAGEQGIEAGK